MKLLLIEDNATMQTTLRRSFERRGMQVLGCEDGARALARNLRFFIFRKGRDRDIELERERTPE